MDHHCENPLSIEELWLEHRNATFPRECRGKDVNGIDFVVLDADIAGCVATFLHKRALDTRRTAILGLCYRNAKFVLPLLRDEAGEYFGRLELLAEMILNEIAYK